jgi:hypothetical protein
LFTTVTLPPNRGIGKGAVNCHVSSSISYNSTLGII